ncbi:Flagellar protein FliO [Buchnera aphidicola (Panaphis juglandis)]
MIMQKFFLFFSKDSYVYIKVFVLIFLCIVLLKSIFYISMLNKTSKIKIISRVFLDNNNKIFIVNILDRQLILGVTPHSMTILRISSLSKNLKIKFRWYNHMIFFLFDNFSLYKFFF